MCDWVWGIIPHGCMLSHLVCLHHGCLHVIVVRELLWGCVCPIGTLNVVCVGICVSIGSSGGRPTPLTPCSSIFGGW